MDALHWVGAWGRSSLEEVHHTCPGGTKSLDWGMGTKLGASSIRESDQVVRVLGACVPTLAVGACMETYGCWVPSYPEQDYPEGTPLAQGQGNGSSGARGTWVRSPDDCSAVEEAAP